MKEAEGFPLASLTTMHVGGPARRLVIAESIDEIVDTVREVDDADEELLVISGGSNLVIADAGFDGTVLRIANEGITLESDDACGGAMVRVAAGTEWDEFVEHCCAHHYSGVESLSGIPGLAGATPVQNVGAYGQEVAQTIAQVRVYDRHRQEVRTFANADCRFTYRHSIFKGTSRFVVLDVLFQLRTTELSQPIAYADLAAGLGVEQGARVPLADAREAVLAQRRKRGMVLDPDDHDTWSCGSFFTNPILSPQRFARFEQQAAQRLGADGPTPPKFPGSDGSLKTSAAWLIDKAGFGKGYGMPGPAALSTKHTLAITNRGNATANDIAVLAREVQAGVRDAFGIDLVNEPVFVGHQL
ncbi:UDP-N-acetylmuramate dehydrogenase [Calidifontibacter terrae]